MNNLTTMMYCKKCGQIEYGSKNHECSFCKFIMTSTGLDKYKWESKREIEKTEYADKLLVKIKLNSDYDEKIYSKRLNKEFKDKVKSEKRIKYNKRYDYNQKLEREELERKAEHQPKCPTCQSPNIHKISGANKVGSALLFGIFAVGHVGKTFKCDNCGAKF